MDAPRSRLVDSHVHFWDPTLLPYPWLAHAPSIASRHTPDSLTTEAGPDAPDELIFIQADCEGSRSLDEVEWVEGLASEHQSIRGIVAFAPMDRGKETDERLELLARRPLVRGVRHLIQSETDPGFCARPAFVAGVRRLADHGLCFDLCVRSEQLGQVTRLVQNCPDTSFLLDHAGKPGIRAGRVEPWRSELRELASLPNVAVKMSGLVTEADPSWTAGQLAPYVDHILECFGPARTLFGSDWPVVKLAGSFRNWLQAARALCQTLSVAEQSALFYDNARRVYGLGSSR